VTRGYIQHFFYEHSGILITLLDMYLSSNYLMTLKKLY